MNRYVVEEAAVHARASATPIGRPSARGPRQGQEREREELPEVARDAPLGDLQRWFAGAVMTPQSAPAPASEDEVARVLTPNARMSALERLEIYRSAYHARLVECLADDYPVLQRALGEGDFEELCREYVSRHPSRSPSLNFFGRAFAAFCRHEAPPPFPLRELAGDLAELEWAIVEVIHARSSTPLTLEGLRDVPADAWAGARLVPNEAARLLRFTHPVNAYFQAIKNGEAPALPSPAPSATVVYRSGATVWRMDLTPAMFEVLAALAEGQGLEASLERARPSLADVDEDVAGQRVLAWFREWVQSGLFARVQLSAASS